jgi:hypothetical protein
VVCHSAGGGNSFLEPLPPGRESWDEEQSFRNFERIQRLIVPGEPLESVLLVNPLAEEAGGSHWHAGGKHWVVPVVPQLRADPASDRSGGAAGERAAGEPAGRGGGRQPLARRTTQDADEWQTLAAWVQGRMSR